MSDGPIDISDESGKELAAAAKARGTTEFAKGNQEGYERAIVAYKEAEAHDSTDHVFPSNICACYLELAKKEWEPAKKVTLVARAFEAACKCTALNPTWVKGFLRKATAEAELLSAVEDHEERKKERKDPVDYDGKPWPEPDPSMLPIMASASYASCESTCRAGLELDRGNAGLRLRLQQLRDRGVVGGDKEAMDRALVDADAAAPLKAEGNAAFAAKKYQDAAEKCAASHQPRPSPDASSCELDARLDARLGASSMRARCSPTRGSAHAGTRRRSRTIHSTTSSTQTALRATPASRTRRAT